MSIFSTDQLGARRRSALVHRVGWAVSATVTFALGALTLAGPALAAPASASPGSASNVNSIIATIPVPAVGTPEFTNVDPVRGVVWTAGPSAISEISESTNQVIQTYRLIDYPDAMTVDPQTGDVLLGNTNATLTILNGQTGAQKVVNVGTKNYFFARGVAVDPTTGLIYVTDTTLDTVSQPGFANSMITVVNEGTGKVVDQIFDPNCADQVTIDASTHTIYVANSNPGATFDQGSSVWVMDEANNRVHDTIYEPSGYPDAMALDPVSDRLFIPNIYDGPLTVINTRKDQVRAEVTLPGSGLEPYPVTADSSNGMVYVDNYGSTQVYVVDEKTDAVVDTITVPVTYGGLDVDPNRALLYQGSDLAAVNGSTSTVEAIKVAP